MAKVTGGLLSLKASGTIAKTITFGSWKGVDYARQRVIPANPQSTEQTLTRKALAFCVALYKLMGSAGRAPWAAYAKGQKFSGFNAFQSFNIPLLRGETDLTALQGSPGALGGPAPSSVTIVTGGSAGEIDVTLTAPTPPNGWVLAGAACMATKDVDPSTESPVDYFEETETAPLTGMTLTGLVNAADYSVCAWLVWTTDTGKTAYSVSTTDVVTSHA